MPNDTMTMTFTIPPEGIRKEIFEGEASMREKILNEALAIVTTDRQDAYGNPEDNFGTIARLWSDYMGIEFEPLHVAIMMALLKIARISTGKYKADKLYRPCRICGLCRRDCGADGGQIDGCSKVFSRVEPDVRHRELRVLPVL